MQMNINPRALHIGMTRKSVRSTIREIYQNDFVNRTDRHYFYSRVLEYNRIRKLFSFFFEEEEEENTYKTVLPSVHVAFIGSRLRTNRN